MNKLKIKDYDELVQRENLFLDHHVTLTNFDSLISVIELPKNQQNLTNCQIHQKQNTCNHHFMHGFLVLTKENKEAIIGADCGNKYFELDEKFSLQKNKLESEIAMLEALETLSIMLTNFDQGRITNTEGKLKEIAANIRTCMSKYPELIKRKLEKMEKSRNSAVSIEVDYGEVSEDGQKVSNWVTENVGSVKGTYIWQYHENVGYLFSSLNEIKQTFPNINLDKKQNVKQSALIAFRWAQFPPEQEYEVGGDWNQGMLSLGLPASSRFDINVRWDVKGKEYETVLRGVQCAK